MHEQLRNPKISRLNRRHIPTQDHVLKIDRLSKLRVPRHPDLSANHQISYKKSLAHKLPEMIPGTTLNKDALAEAMHHYLLPNPDNQHERPVGVNLDCCCQDYGIGIDKYMDALSYQSTPSESGRHRWDWVEGQLP